MPYTKTISRICTLCLVCLGCSTVSYAKEWFADWTMEDRVASSQLILVARASNVSSMTIVYGGKASTTIREYRFQPVRRLKGVFGRDELALTSSDLGLPEGDGSTPPPLQQGELCLLLLARTAEGFSCVSAPQGVSSVRQQVPRLSGPDDPVIAMTETLIRTTELPSRQARVTELAKGLGGISGAAAVPLLDSLRRRAIWAAQAPAIADSVVPLVRNESPAVRTAALQTIESILAAAYLRQDEVLAKYAGAIRGATEQGLSETAAQTAAVRAIGYLGQFGREQPWPSQLLVQQLTGASTYAQRDAAIVALEHLGDSSAAASVMQSISSLPLDEDDGREQLFFTAAASLDDAQLLPLLLARLTSTIAAEQSPQIEIKQLGDLRSHEATPTLLKVAGVSASKLVSADAAGDGTADAIDPWYDDGTTVPTKIELARAFEKIADPRAAGLLSIWLRDRSLAVREQAFAALEAINTQTAVTAVRLRLKAEPHLPLKLRMARFLGRHGIQDGYPFAIEHIADSGLTELAAEALATIRDDRAQKELWQILETSHDHAWNGAALVGLAAVGDDGVKPRLVEILENPRDPLVPQTATAAGYLKDPDALPRLSVLIGSRNIDVARSAIEAIARLAADGPGNIAGGPDAERFHESGTALLALLDDPFADTHLRIRALEVLRDVGDPRLGAALRRLADQAELEGNPLLPPVEAELRRAATEH